MQRDINLNPQMPTAESFTDGDVCNDAHAQNASLADCLQPLFEGASENDALVIGARVFGKSLTDLHTRCGVECGSGLWCTETRLLAASLAHERADELLEELLDVFPGKVGAVQCAVVSNHLHLHGLQRGTASTEFPKHTTHDTF